MPNNNDDEGVFLEINLRKCRWLVFAGYNPKLCRITPYLDNVGKIFSKYVNKYDNILMLGDFNVDMLQGKNNNKMYDFFENYGLKNIVNEPTCFKNPNSPTSMDLIITNRKDKFHDTTLIETGLSDHHKMTVTCIKRYIKKMPPKLFVVETTQNFMPKAFERISKIHYKTTMNQS